MTYTKFVYYYRMKLHGRVFLICGENTYMREDALGLLERKVKRDLGRFFKGQFLKKVYYMTELADEPFQVMYSVKSNFRVIRWDPNILNKEDTILFLKELNTLPGWSVIISADLTLKTIFEKLFPFKKEEFISWAGLKLDGMVIECSRLPCKLGSFIERRVKLVLDVGIDEETVMALETLPSEGLFATFRSIDVLQQKALSYKDISKYGLSKIGAEVFLVKVLLNKGRKRVLQFDLSNIDFGIFLKILFSRLVLLLKIKTQHKKRSYMAAGELDISPQSYMYHKSLADDFKLKELYNKLYLVISSFRWSSRKSSIMLFLRYWK